MITTPLPTTEEVAAWLLTSLRHSCQVEYYLYLLDLGHNDPQRPHDIMGDGNKFSWQVIKGLAMQYRNISEEFFNEYVLPSIEIHRKGQYHHKMWNGMNHKATPDDMVVGAIDSLSSLRQNRPYQGGSHSYIQIVDIIKKNKRHKHKWFWMVYSQMKRTPDPRLERIVDLHNFPNIGLPDEVYDGVVSRTQETLIMLKGDHGYDL